MTLTHKKSTSPTITIPKEKDCPISSYSIHHGPLLRPSSHDFGLSLRLGLGWFQSQSCLDLSEFSFRFRINSHTYLEICDYGFFGIVASQAPRHNVHFIDSFQLQTNYVPGPWQIIILFNSLFVLLE